jgi:hypothetical protein
LKAVYADGHNFSENILDDFKIFKLKNRSYHDLAIMFQQFSQKLKYWRSSFNIRANSLIHIANFKVKNGLFICEFKIHGPK